MIKLLNNFEKKIKQFPMKKITTLLLLFSAFSFAQIPQIDSFSPYSAAVA